jgi:hypothetical protein
VPRDCKEAQDVLYSVRNLSREWAKEGWGRVKGRSGSGRESGHCLIVDVREYPAGKWRRVRILAKFQVPCAAGDGAAATSLRPWTPLFGGAHWALDQPKLAEDAVKALAQALLSIDILERIRTCTWVSGCEEVGIFRCGAFLCRTLVGVSSTFRPHGPTSTRRLLKSLERVADVVCREATCETKARLKLTLLFGLIRC